MLSMSRLQNNIQRRMAELGLNGATLAAKAKISKQHMYRILKGERDSDGIGFLKLQALARALKTSISELTGDPAFKDLEALLAKASDHDRRIFEAIADLPPDHHKRRTILDILGIEDPEARESASKQKK
jgi:transcriptional regulator with XRE-family HTH domain